MNLFEKIGEQSIILYQLFFIQNYMIFNNKHSLVMFILIFVNIFINLITKLTLIKWMKNLNHKLPILGSFCRPNDPKCEKLTMTGYGMPSGHSQISSFIPSFYYFYYKNREDFSFPIFITYVSIAIYIMYSRYTSNMHSIQQIILGSMFGILLGYIIAKVLKPLRIL